MLMKAKMKNNYTSSQICILNRKKRECEWENPLNVSKIDKLHIVSMDVLSCIRRCEKGRLLAYRKSRIYFMYTIT